MKSAIIGMLVLVAGSSFASGFKCEDVNGDGFRVKLFNRTTGGTRVPSKLVISHTEASPATLLVASDSEISKSNRANVVRYTVDGSEMNLDTAILQIRFLEGRDSIAKGETAEGQLILVDHEGNREVSHLVCERYLKGE